MANAHADRVNVSRARAGVIGFRGPGECDVNRTNVAAVRIQTRAHNTMCTKESRATSTTGEGRVMRA